MNRQNKRIEIRVSSFEKKLLQIKASEVGLSLSEYMRSSSLGKSIVRPPTTEEMEVYLLLKNYQSNFSRIANIFKKMDYPQLEVEILEVKAEIMKHLKFIEDGKQG